MTATMVASITRAGSMARVYAARTQRSVPRRPVRKMAVSNHVDRHLPDMRGACDRTTRIRSGQACRPEDNAQILPALPDMQKTPGIPGVLLCAILGSNQ